MTDLVVPVLRVLVVVGVVVLGLGLFLVRRADRRMERFFATLDRHGWEEVE